MALRKAFEESRSGEFVSSKTARTLQRATDQTGINRPGNAIIYGLLVSAFRLALCSIPKANATCDRAIGTLRRECLDYVIPPSMRHLRRVLKLWVTHHNRSRPHSAIGPDIPFRVTKPSANVVRLPRNIKPNDRIIATPIIGGLHHDYKIMVA